MQKAKSVKYDPAFAKAPRPVPVKLDIRIAFAIAYYKTAEEAAEAGRLVEESGVTYNGGWFHGMACGRDSSWDYTDPNEGRLYAVTF